MTLVRYKPGIKADRLSGYAMITYVEVLEVVVGLTGGVCTRAVISSKVYQVSLEISTLYVTRPWAMHELITGATNEEM
jgi:hypothetical protein